MCIEIGNVPQSIQQHVCVELWECMGALKLCLIFCNNSCWKRIGYLQRIASNSQPASPSRSACWCPASVAGVFSRGEGRCARIQPWTLWGGWSDGARASFYPKLQLEVTASLSLHHLQYHLVSTYDIGNPFGLKTSLLAQLRVLAMGKYLFRVLLLSQVEVAKQGW